MQQQNATGKEKKKMICLPRQSGTEIACGLGGTKPTFQTYAMKPERK